MIGRTGIGVLARDVYGMFVMMVFMPVVHVTIVQIVGVPFVLNRGVAAIGTMGMVSVVALIVSFVIVGHGLFLLSGEVKVHEANEVRACERTKYPLMLVPWYRNVSLASTPPVARHEPQARLVPATTGRSTVCIQPLQMSCLLWRSGIIHRPSAV